MSSHHGPAQFGDEHCARIWAGIAMWSGGAGALLAASVLGTDPTTNVTALRLIALACLAWACVYPPRLMHMRGRTLDAVDSVFSVVGACAICAGVYCDGGALSGLMSLYFFPVLFNAYFRGLRPWAIQLGITCLLILTPALYSTTLAGTQFPARAAILMLTLAVVSIAVRARKQSMLAALAGAERRARQDPLTGACNLRGLREHVRARPLAAASGVLLFDVDNFKQLNSELGHTGADRLLSAVARGLRSVAQDGDCVARIGGDEFVLVAYERDSRELHALGERCSEAISDSVTSADPSADGFECSMGIARWRDGASDLDAMLTAADQWMFAHKTMRRTGRDATRRESQPPQSFASRGHVEARRHPSERPAPQRPARAASRPALGAATTAGAVWLASAAIMAAVVLAPYSQASSRAVAAAVVLTDLMVGAAILALAREHRDHATALSAFASAILLPLSIYATGGVTSPLLPFVVFCVVFACYFYEGRKALTRVLAAAFAGTTPFMYATASGRVAFIVTYMALAITELVVAGVLLYCRRQLTCAERASLELALHDPLTGLANRRAFFERLQIPADTQTRTVALLDLDNFKQVNDTHGHSAGDGVLVAIAAAMREVVRPADLVARIGGDEFALVTDGLDDLAARHLGERLLDAVERAAAGEGCADCGVSATVGYTQIAAGAACPDHVIEAADLVLMEAKAEGKRRVVAATTADAAGTVTPTRHERSPARRAPVTRPRPTRAGTRVR